MLITTIVNFIIPLKATLDDRVAHRRSSKYGLTALEWEDKKAKEIEIPLPTSASDDDEFHEASESVSWKPIYQLFVLFTRILT